jgi:hypothetical protein
LRSPQTLPKFRFFHRPQIVLSSAFPANMPGKQPLKLMIQD